MAEGYLQVNFHLTVIDGTHGVAPVHFGGNCREVFAWMDRIGHSYL